MRSSLFFGVFCSVVALGSSASVLAAENGKGRSIVNKMMVHADLAPDGRRLRATYEAMGAAASASQAQASVRSQLQSRLPFGFELGAGSSASHRVQQGQARSIDIYPVTYRGIALGKGSDVMAVSTADGRLLHRRQRGVPIDVDATQASLPAADAVSAGQDALASRFAEADSISATTPVLEIWVPGDQHGRLSWTYHLRNNSLTNPISLQVWVAAADAASADILHVENAIHRQHSGTVTGDIWDMSPLNPTVNRGLSDVTVTRFGEDSTDRVVTDLEGAFSYEDGTGDVFLGAAPVGPLSRIQDAAGDGTVLRTFAIGSPDVPATVAFNAEDDLDIAQLTAFHFTNVAQRIVAGFIDPEGDLIDLSRLPIIVNIPDVCNAFYDPVTVTTNYFQAGIIEFEDDDGETVTLDCPNSAYGDVVLHEFGHAFDDAKGGILDGGYSEGFSDAVALLQTRDSCLGDDFLRPGSCLRPADEVVLWPPTEEEIEFNDVHAIGRRYAGFVWEFVQQLLTTYSEDEAFEIATEINLAAAQANPADVPDAVFLSFIVDDDDGDLSNGTPHSEELEAAAMSRNIPVMHDMSALAYRFMRKRR